MPEKEDSLTLEILEMVEGQSNVTQRHLADQLGVALGLANSYLKRCVRKGLIKIHQAPANRYLYYLTPKGLTEKSRLTANYLSLSFDFYRKASSSIADVYKDCLAKNYKRILLCGVSELAEIASLRALQYELHITGMFDPAINDKTFLHHKAWDLISNADMHDCCLLTSVHNTKDVYDLLIKSVNTETILIPSILGISAKEIDSKIKS